LFRERASGSSELAGGTGISLTFCQKMIQRYIIFLLYPLAVLLGACSEDVRSGLESVARDELIEIDGVLQLKDGGSPFSGTSQSFYSDGRLREEFQIRDGVRHGPMTRWHPNGSVFRKVNYKGGSRDGMQGEWDSVGSKSSETHFRNGLRHGRQTVWYVGGGKKVETEYQDGKKHGIEAEWYVSGQKRTETTYEAGEKNGLSIRWDWDGHKQLERPFVAGVLHGTVFSWSDDGTLRSDVFFERGRPTGRQTVIINENAEQAAAGDGDNAPN
jgi:antitoxin component YwqK of YwqJK toxin-antitoxin module